MHAEKVYYLDITNELNRMHYSRLNKMCALWHKIITDFKVICLVL